MRNNSYDWQKQKKRPGKMLCVYFSYCKITKTCALRCRRLSDEAWNSIFAEKSRLARLCKIKLRILRKKFTSAVFKSHFKVKLCYWILRPTSFSRRCFSFFEFKDVKFLFQDCLNWKCMIFIVSRKIVSLFALHKTLERVSCISMIYSRLFIKTLLIFYISRRTEEKFYFPWH